MDRLQSMRAFSKVVEAGSFARAAALMDRDTASVTRLVADLERHLGARLLNRTTRSLSLTEAGTGYLLRCRRILEDVDDAEALARENTGQVRGRLRMLAGTTLGLEILAPRLAGFRERHPDVIVELDLTDRPVDLVGEGYDLAVGPRLAEIPGHLVARRLFDTPVILAAAPGYLAARGIPRTPADLARHACLNFRHEALREHWTLHGAGGDLTVPIATVLLSNNADVLRVAARSGMGICVTGERVVEQDLRAGTLVRVLPDYAVGTLEIHIAYPGRRFLPAKVRAMIDFLSELAQAPAGPAQAATSSPPPARPGAAGSPAAAAGRRRKG